MRFDSFVFTNAGGREYNEDAAAQRELSDGQLYIVADGLGGHEHGDKASAYAIDTLMKAPPPAAEEDETEWLKAQIEAANAGILECQKESRSVMKSTVVSLLIRDKKAVWANVGDSRLYYLHGGEIVAVTEDHSVAYKKYRAGEITRAQICFDEDQSALLQALGNPERHVPSCYAADAPLEDGDGFLLCSDGAWEYLPDGEILVDFLKAETAKDWAEHLMLRVISRVQSGNDNLSLITVMVRGEGCEDETV